MVSTLLLYLLFLAGLLLLFLRGCSTATPSGGSAEDGAFPPPVFQAPAPTAKKSVLAFVGGTLLWMVCSWGFARLFVPEAGHMHSWVPSDHEHFLPLLWMCSTAGFVALLAFRVISARNHLTFGDVRGCAPRVGPLLVLFCCSGLIHILVPGKGGGGGLVDVDPAGLEIMELPLFFPLLLCSMGIMMLISFLGAASVNPGNARTVNVPRQSSTDPAQLLVAFSCAGLVEILVRTTEGRGSGGLVRGGLELPILFLFLALMVSLTVVLSRISA